MGGEFWEVDVNSSGVVHLVPPRQIDKKYDDLLLEVTGNMLDSDKSDAAIEIVNSLNSEIINSK